MRSLSPYVLPALLTMAGGALLIVGLLQRQNAWALFGAGLALIAGMVSFALQLRLIGRKAGLVIGVVLILLAALLAWRNHRSARNNGQPASTETGRP